MQRISLRQRRQLTCATRVALALCIVGIAAMGVWAVQPNQRASAATKTPKLLLVHGFDDSCQDGFASKVLDGSGNWVYWKTIDYLTQYGWLRSAIDMVGYYNSSVGHLSKGMNGVQYSTYDFTATSSIQPSGSLPGGIPYVPCDSNLQEWRTLSTSTGAKTCDNTFPGSFGTLSDPIEHLGCLLSWYIYDTSTSVGQPVYILAHSMGGLIVRDAIGESGSGKAAFPPGKVDVRAVVTLGTPHGGLWGFYLDAAQSRYSGSVEVQDMAWTSSFMGIMNSLQRPQGASGTFWELIAGSVGCGTNGGTAIYNCQPYYDTRNLPFPDGDGVVQADSALAMAADNKILYGQGDCESTTSYSCGAGIATATFSADNNMGDLSSAYSHQANACYGPANGCFAYPYYLNDGTGPTPRVLAYTCSGAANCTAGHAGGGGMADMKVLDSSGNSLTGQSTRYSLAEVIYRLPPPSTCSSTTESDNNQVGSYTDNRGNTWYVYYDLTRDISIGLPCQMRVVVRIFDPAPDGTWSGTAAVWAERNGGYLAASFGKVSGSGTYQYHFVWRGPWFSVSPGNYYIEDTEYNGSNPYARASGSFTI